VTITDERLTRYFMTIPEAIELVLQGSTLGSQGNLYMLDMASLCLSATWRRRSSTCPACAPARTCPIGARAGEKLHEELWNFGAEVVPTQFKRVYEVMEEPVTEDFTVALRRLEEAALERDHVATSEALKMLPINFSSTDFSTNGSALNVNAD
jgi:FlaA1/EpsC-like NDP-sugar epimerase